MSNYSTGEMARLCGVSVRTVQYYDTRGVLSPTELSEGGRRLYSEEDLSKMKIICFLRELDFSLDAIARLLCEENSKEVIALLLEEQRAEVLGELRKREAQLEKIEALSSFLSKDEKFSLKSIGDVAHVMKQKSKLSKMYTLMLLTGIPLAALQVTSIVLWITSGLWWLFAIWAAIAVPYGIGMSCYYFKRVAYICPDCHEVFVPRFREAFWAPHTPRTRKLTCPKCSHRSYCVETYRETEK